MYERDADKDVRKAYLLVPLEDRVVGTDGGGTADRARPLPHELFTLSSATSLMGQKRGLTCVK